MSYSFNSCKHEIKKAISNKDDIEKYFIELLGIYGIHSEIISKLKNSPFNLSEKDDNYETHKLIHKIFSEIDELNSNLEDAKYEADELFDEVDRLERDVEENSSFDEFKIDPPSGYNEEELLKVVIDVYHNANRLDNGDLQILKILSQKTL